MRSSRFFGRRFPGARIRPGLPHSVLLQTPRRGTSIFSRKTGVSQPWLPGLLQSESRSMKALAMSASKESRGRWPLRKIPPRKIPAFPSPYRDSHPRRGKSRCRLCGTNNAQRNAAKGRGESWPFLTTGIIKKPRHNNKFPAPPTEAGRYIFSSHVWGRWAAHFINFSRLFYRHRLILYDSLIIIIPWN